jgi:hypothetical protein
MKKWTILFLVLISANVFGQTRQETTVKLVWEEQAFFRFYSKEYSVYVSKPDFLNFDNELLIGLFAEFAQKQDSMNLENPFSTFTKEQQRLLWSQLIKCTMNGQLFIHPIHSNKRLKSVVIIDDKTVQGSAGTIWECRDPKTKQVIFSHSVASIGAANF